MEREYLVGILTELRKKIDDQYMQNKNKIYDKIFERSHFILALNHEVYRLRK